MLIRRTFSFTAALLGVTALAWWLTFPGRQTPLALTMATGWNVGGLQQRVDTLEARAIAGDEFSEDDLRFLTDLYRCGVKIGELTGVAPTTAVLVDHWLDGRGADVRIDAELVRNSRPVRREMRKLREHIAWEAERFTQLPERYESFTFYMGDPSTLDGVASLYFGKLIVRPTTGADGEVAYSWRAEIPWTWPTYDELFEKHAHYHAQNFALPNLSSVLLDRGRALRIDDGLGGHLQELGLARPFLVYAEWRD